MFTLSANFPGIEEIVWHSCGAPVLGLCAAGWITFEIAAALRRRSAAGPQPSGPASGSPPRARAILFGVTILSLLAALAIALFSALWPSARFWMHDFHANASRWRLTLFHGSLSLFRMSGGDSMSVSLSTLTFLSLTPALFSATIVWLVRLLPPKYGPAQCSRCGYDLRATPNQCPECGAQQR